MSDTFSSVDNSLVATAGAAGVLVRELPTGNTVYQSSDTGLMVDVAFIPGKQEIAIASRKSLHIADLLNQQNSETLFEGSIRYMSVSPDGAFLAVADKRGIQLYEMATGGTTNCMSNDWVTSLCFSRNGKLLAAGDRDGCVSMIDTSTGNVIWSVSPPGRHRPPWTFPTAMLVLWAWVCRLLSRKRALVAKDGPSGTNLEPP